MITGFFTDSTVCIGCKACEVACKEWNEVPADGYEWGRASYDHTRALGHSTWRHVLFVERHDADPVRWSFLSDVCKHCENAGCLEACPTGSIVRTEVGSVYVQPDVCNGCGYCVVACPFGVVDRRPEDGRAFKCTFCYDRQHAGLAPACASVCPTESISFGPLEDMQAKARARLEELHARGMADARLYTGEGGSVDGTHALFLTMGDPADYNLPPQPEVPTVHLRPAWTSAAITAGALLLAAAGAALWRE
ncbi:MAG: 4Fe-4S dicluster domain-containing protein [Armatimonadetes bacterium]|nr:4Fe-4S dicluster domain-containing protein [Armatimonadota bacterium]